MAAFTSVTPALRISSAVMTVAPIGVRAGSLAKRAPVTCTVETDSAAASGTSAAARAAPANRERETAQASAIGVLAGALFETTAVMILVLR
ncbi:hypothetical protein [Massilia sp. Se16.2.3]|uniref:hypothetical protein n=1 Tax=Massilia sp. Se16.2.3 TaxID=2709303 RepID=UPI0023DDA9CA|nr:hypothetical protein [Massilia sp. Se16.2.3]